MADKLMYIPKDDTQNYPLCRLQFVVKTSEQTLNEPTNQNSISPQGWYANKQGDDDESLRTSVINSPLYPSFLLKRAKIYISVIQVQPAGKSFTVKTVDVACRSH